MSDDPIDFKTDDDDDPTEICSTCGGYVLAEEAFCEDGSFYHARCAGVWRCSNCGKWNDNAVDVCECGDPKP